MTARFFRCRKCLKPRPVPERMKLWDGRSYCASCVRAFSPRLAEYAAAHPRWKESAPWCSRALWRKTLRIELGVFLLIACIAACFAFQEWGATGILLGFASAAFICAIHILISLPKIFGTEPYLPRVSIENGVLSTRHRGWWWSPCFNYQLRKMRWHIGKPKHDIFLRLNHLTGFMPRRPVVILVCKQILFGREFDVPWLRMGIACGWDNETRQILIDFLAFCGVPRCK